MAKKRLGDKVEAAIEAVIPKYLLDALGNDCGCSERKAQLNHLEVGLTVITKEMQLAINQALVDLLGEKRAKRTACGSCLRNRVLRLREKIKQLKKEMTVDITNEQSL